MAFIKKSEILRATFIGPVVPRPGNSNGFYVVEVREGRADFSFVETLAGRGAAKQTRDILLNQPTSIAIGNQAGWGRLVTYLAAEFNHPAMAAAPGDLIQYYRYRWMR